MTCLENQPLQPVRIAVRGKQSPKEPVRTRGACGGAGPASASVGPRDCQMVVWAVSEFPVPVVVRLLDPVFEFLRVCALAGRRAWRRYLCEFLCLHRTAAAFRIPRNRGVGGNVGVSMTSVLNSLMVSCISSPLMVCAWSRPERCLQETAAASGGGIRNSHVEVTTSSRPVCGSVIACVRGWSRS